MSRFLVPLLTLALFVPQAGSAPKPKGPPKLDLPSLVGSWAVESETWDGTSRPTTPLVVTDTADGRSEERIRDKVVRTGTFAVNPGKGLAEIDLGTDGRAEEARLGVYKVEGDTLTICVSIEPAVRPKGFDTPAGSYRVLSTYKRVKP